jgi:hypothetical protein
MTFSEALEAMKQGYKVRREDWEDGLYRVMAFNSFTIIENSNGENIIAEYVSNILATDWEIYNEPKPEPQFEIGELVMMRDRIDSKWFPEHFAHYEPKKEVPYMAISGRDYVQCAKFDKDIVFTNKPAKL